MNVATLPANLLPASRILVIDDNRAIHQDFRKIFGASRGASTPSAAEEALLGGGAGFKGAPAFQVDSAYQGQEGLALVRRAQEEGNPYAMAFVDVRMPPGWDGMETTAQIWRHDPDIQIVICTAYSDYSWSEMLDKLGRSDRLVILKKPFDTIEVVQLASALTEKWRLARQSRSILEDLERRVAVRTRELQQTSELKSAILESSLDCIVTIDHEGKILEFNPAAEAAFGLKREQALGKLMVDLIVPPRLRDAHRRGFARCLATGEGPILGKRLELEAVRADGTEFPIELAITAIGATATPMFTGFIRDITVRKRADERIRRLNRIYAVLSGINSAIVRIRNCDELFREACRIAVEDGKFRMAWIGLAEPDLGKARPVSWMGANDGYLDEVGLALDNVALDQGAGGRALREKRSIVFNDIETDPQVVFRQEALARGYRSLAVLPLLVGEEATGVLVLYAGEAGFFDEEEMKLLRELAGDIAFALENIERQQKLDKLARIRAVSSETNAAIVRIRERKALLEETCRIVSEHGKFEMIWIGAVDGGAQQVQPIAWKGFSDEAARAVNWASITSSKGTLGEAIATRMPSVRNDIEGELPGGTLRGEALKAGCRSSVCLPLMVDGTVVALVVLFATGRGFFDEEELGLLAGLAGNISFALEHIEKEEKVERLTRVYAVLSGINALIVRVKERAELFDGACRIAVEHGKFAMAWVGTFDPATQDVTPVAWAGESAQTLTRAKSSSREDTPAGTGAVGRCIRERRPVFNNDIAAHHFGGPRLQEILRLGFQSQIALPLYEEQAIVAILTMYTREQNFFDDEELRLLTGLAGDISFALENLSRQAQLDYLAYYDPLTGLANRRLFLERVAQYMRSAVTGGHKLALFLVDLERFKNINDSLGRPAGDALLKQVAEWLTRHVEDANLVARVGADHFAVVLPQIRQNGSVARLVEKAVEGFQSHPFRLNDAVFRIALKVGIALFPEDGTDADILLKNVEAALKKAKTSGERYLFYTQKMTDTLAGKLTLENQLRQALDKEEFVLHYQPKISLATGKLTSAEALLRWNDPRTGMVPPGRFIPVLEETGLIQAVGRWALRKAIEDYLRWRAAGLPAVRIAVNVSALQLRNRGFIAEIEQAIGIGAHAADGLELEITESMIMEDVKHNIASLQAIRALGVTTAIDDFGTGFSSLSYLSKLPIDTLKIDRSFVVDMTVGPQGLALVSTIITLAHSLKLKVVAEGVETEEQQRLLRLLGCDEMQGYLFSKPVPGEIFQAKFLAPAAAEGSLGREAAAT